MDEPLSLENLGRSIQELTLRIASLEKTSLAAHHQFKEELERTREELLKVSGELETAIGSRESTASEEGAPAEEPGEATIQDEWFDEVSDSEDEPAEHEPSEAEATRRPSADPLPLPIESIPQNVYPEKETAPVFDVDLETRIGAVWFNRIGLVVLIIGFALMARYVHEFLQPWHKVAASYLASAVLFGIGWFLEERLRLFARPVMAGGMSLAFFTSFAGYFVTPMKCLPLPASLFLMAACVGWIVLVAERWKSEPTAGLAIFLGHVAAYTAGGDADTFSLAAIFFLSLTAFVLFLRNDWLPLSLFAVVASFLSHLLWALQDHPVTTPRIQFWTNFCFLTSYYAIFLCADLVYRHRVWKRGREAYALARRAAGRGVGPAALTLYATLAAAFFYATKIYWDSIHLFLFPLAALQMFLVDYHRKRASRDYPIYAAAAIAFATLGFFSWIGGLALNLTLAAEALLLLVLARRLKFWFLNPLAQIVLLINFIHYWNSDARSFETWPTYLGSVATALVYFVKSRFEETWEYGVRDEEVPESAWSARLRISFDGIVKPLGYLHALVGAFLLAYQCHTFFDAPFEAFSLALFAVAAVAATLYLRSDVWTLGVWALQAGCALFLLQHFGNEAAPNERVTPEWFWIANHGTVLALVGGAWAASVLSRRFNDSLYFVLGSTGLFLCVPSILAASGSGEPNVWFFPLWMIAPLVFWIETDLCRKALGSGSEGEEAPVGWLEKNGMEFPMPLLREFFALAASGVTFFATLRAFPSASSALWALSIISLAVLCATVVRGNPFLALGLVTHLAYEFVYLLATPSRSLPSYEIWWLIASGIGIAAVLTCAGVYVGRVAFVWAALATLLLGFDAVAWMLAVESVDPAPIALWFIAVLASWITIELLRVVFDENDKNAYERWTDRLGVNILAANSLPISVVLSLLGSFILALLASIHFEGATSAAWMSLFFMILFALAAGLFRSVSLAAACYLTLTASHYFAYSYTTYAHTGAHFVSLHHPGLALFLVALPIALSATAEFFLTGITLDVRDKWRAASVAAIGYPYALAFVMAAVFFETRAGEVYGRFVMAYPLQAAMALGLFVLGWRFRLGWTQLAASVFAGWTLLRIATLTVFHLKLRHEADLFTAALIVAVLLIAIERVLFHQDKKILDSIRDELSLLLRRAAIVSSGALMVFVIRFSEQMRASWITFGWSLVAVSLMGLGFLWKTSAYRRTALAIFVLSIGRAAMIDVARLELFYRMLAFLCLGACLLVVSFLYTRYKDDIKRWI